MKATRRLHSLPLEQRTRLVLMQQLNPEPPRESIGWGIVLAFGLAGAFWLVILWALGFA